MKLHCEFFKQSHQVTVPIFSVQITVILSPEIYYLQFCCKTLDPNIAHTVHPRPEVKKTDHVYGYIYLFYVIFTPFYKQEFVY